MKMTLRSWLGLGLVMAAAAGAQQWAAASHRASVGAEVAALVQAGSIHMMVSDSCAICEVARRWFVQHGVAFSECSIERDSACRTAFEATRAPGTPVLVINGRTTVGFSPERVRTALSPRS
jgi:glutaredoxin